MRKKSQIVCLFTFASLVLFTVLQFNNSGYRETDNLTAMPKPGSVSKNMPAQNNTTCDNTIQITQKKDTLNNIKSTKHRSAGIFHTSPQVVSNWFKTTIHSGIEG